MKEFSAQTGGRYTYVDDILNLQHLALAFASIFDSCDNFIVSGCEVKGSSLSSGYVYINGKLRYFSGVSAVDSWPQYLYENNYTETVAYANGADKVGRNVYGCAIGERVPVTADPLTGEVPQFILITAHGGKQMKDAFFGKYALILNPATSLQTVDGTVNFTGDVCVNHAIVTQDKLTVQSGNYTGQIYLNSDRNLVFQWTGESNNYRFVISQDHAFQFYANEQVVLTITDKEIFSRLPIVSQAIKSGNIRITGSNLYNDSVATDNGAIYINAQGYKGESQYFRDTYIGNGKNNIVVAVNGRSSSVSVFGAFSVTSSQAEGIVLKSNFDKSNPVLRKSISWKDLTAFEIGYVGYHSVENNVLEICNGIADVQITGLESVNIGPAVKENGVLLSKKYAQLVYVNGELEKKADKNEVYTSAYTDRMFAKISGGLSQYVSEVVTKSELRKQIDAISLEEALGKMPALNNYLSDMATTEDNKRKICENIGAAYGEDWQRRQQDSGWVLLTEGLYIRQIGNMVSIQGMVTTIHEGVLFTIPNVIDPPPYAVNFSTLVSSYTSQWRCHISGNSRNCVIDFCNHHNVYIPFSITYMV